MRYFLWNTNIYIFINVEVPNNKRSNFYYETDVNTTKPYISINSINISKFNW